MKVTLEELHAFVTICQAGSISRAADQLNLTVSATSRLLGRLESKLATTLLMRTTRRMDLTAEGSTFLASCREIVRSVEAAEEQIAARREQPAGRLRIDSSTPLLLHVVVPLLGEYRRRYPAIQLELLSNERVVDLLEHRADVALRIGALLDSTLHSRSIASSPLRVLASPGYLAMHGHPESVDALRKHTLLGFTQPATLNTWPLPDGSGGMLTVEPGLSAASGEALRQLALRDTGIVCLSDFMTAEDRRQGRLVAVLPQQTLPVAQTIHAVYYRNTAVSSRIASFVNYLSAALEEKPW